MKKLKALMALCCAFTILSAGCGAVSEKFTPQSSADAQNIETAAPVPESETFPHQTWGRC